MTNKIKLRSEPATVTRNRCVMLDESELFDLMMHCFDQGMKSAKLGNDKEARKLGEMLTRQHIDVFIGGRVS